MNSVRTLTFQTEGTYNKIMREGFHTALRKDAMSISREKEDHLINIFDEKGMTLYDDEVPEKYAASIYHWITFEMVRDITDASLAANLSNLVSYYGLRDRVILDLLIPEGEIVILGHPDNKELVESGVRDIYPQGYTEGVTRYIKKEWIQGVYTFDLDYMLDDYLLINVNPFKGKQPILTKDIEFKYSQSYLTFGHKVNEVRGVYIKTEDSLTMQYKDLELVKLKFNEDDTSLEVTGLITHPDVVGDELQQELILYLLRSFNHKNIIITAYTNNHKSLSWYKARGFQVVEFNSKITKLSKPAKHSVQLSSIFS